MTMTVVNMVASSVTETTNLAKKVLSSSLQQQPSVDYKQIIEHFLTGPHLRKVFAHLCNHFSHGCCDKVTGWQLFGTHACCLMEEEVLVFMVIIFCVLRTKLEQAYTYAVAFFLGTWF